MTDNEKRADRAASAICARYDYANMEESISDCMVDLLHLSQQYGMDITDLMERVHNHYEEEIK